MYKLILVISVIFFSSCGPKNYAANDPIPNYLTFDIDSKKVNEKRVINVWLPPDYDTSNTSYPVLYMADGGVREDFPHVANTVSKLITNKSIPPIIVVGIENTKRGRDLTGASEIEQDEKYCPLTDGAKDFRSFITDELMSEINKKYRTNDLKGIIGESLSGLFVMETFFITPEAFDYYIAMDPSLWWNNHYLERKADEILTNFPKKSTSLWFAGSDTEDISKHTRNVAKSLESNAPINLQWTYSDEPNEQHSTIFRATKEKALIWTFDNLK